MASVVEARHVNMLIRRSADVGDLPERKLWRDVICQAVTDLTGKGVSMEDRRSAQRFFTQVGFELVCDAAGIDFEFCADVVARLGQPIGEVEMRD